MIEAGEDVRLAAHPRGARAFVIGDVEDLHGHVAIEHVITGHVDGAHAAVTRDAGNLIAGIELRPCGRIAKPIDRAIRNHRLYRSTNRS